LADEEDEVEDDVDDEYEEEDFLLKQQQPRL